MENIKCNLCGASEAIEYKAAINHLNLVTPISVKRCLNCSMVYLSPRPDKKERNSLHSGDIPELLKPYTKNTAKYTAVSEGRRAFFKDRVAKLVSKIGEITGQKILDVGASSGIFLQEANKMGFKTYGIEPSLDGVNTCRDKGLDVIQSEAENLPYDSNFFDIVHSNHVFEHLGDPSKAIKEAFRVLKPKGMLFIEIPNQFDNIHFKRYEYLGRIPVRERNIRSIHHLFFFSRKTLKKLVKDAHFDKVRIINRYGNKRKGLGVIGSYISRFVGLFFYGGPFIQVIATKPLQ